MPVDWRNHPIYFVGLGCVIGLVFDAQWLAPARLGDFRLEIANARNVVAVAEAEAKKQSQRADVAEGKVANLEKAVAAAERNARDAVTANTFISGSPYPVGFGGIRLGASLSDIEREVPAEHLDKKKRYWVIRLKGSVFESVTVFWDSRAKNPVVTSLTIWANEEVSKDKDFLAQKLRHALGMPDEPQSGFLAWRLSNGTAVFTRPTEFDFMRRSYQIMPSGFGPADWPAPAATGSIKR